jgi:uncharacterized protein (DUF2384 family)
MINDFDIESLIKLIIERILKLNNIVSLILLTDSKSLYDCFVKLSTIAEKRLIIDLMCLRQSYERREIAEIKWTDENINSANAMTKSKFCNVLIRFIDINIIESKIIEWVERTSEHLDKKHFWWDQLKISSILRWNFYDWRSTQRNSIINSSNDLSNLIDWRKNELLTAVCLI